MSEGADAADGRWDEHSLLTAALIASGAENRLLARVRFENFTYDLTDLVAPDAGGPARAQSPRSGTG